MEKGGPRDIFSSVFQRKKMFCNTTRIGNEENAMIDVICL